MKPQILEQVDVLGQDVDKLKHEVFESGQKKEVTLKQGLNVIHPDRVTPLKPKFTGRTLVNLLGRDGNCEDDTAWESVRGTVSLNTNNKVFGDSSINIKADSQQGHHYVRYINPRYGFKHPIENFGLSPSECVFLSVYTIPHVGSSVIILEEYVESGDILKTSASKIVYDTSDFTRIGIKVRLGDLTSTFAIQLKTLNANGEAVYSGVNENASFDGVSLYKISEEEYNTLTEEELLEKYPYVDSYQTLTNPYVIAKGKNLLPPFGRWTVGNGSLKIESPYSIKINASNDDWVYTELQLISSQQYTLSVENIDEGSRVRISKPDGSPIAGTFLASVDSTRHSFTFTAPDDVDKVYVSVARISSSDTNIKNIVNPMLNLGSEPLPFKPQDDSYLYLQTSLAEGETLEEIDGQWVKTKKWEHVVLGGNLGWVFHSSAFSGFKSVKVPPLFSSANVSTELGVKYNGKILETRNGSFTSGDQINLASDYTIYVAVPNSDSGWGDSYTPTHEEIRAYFMGWRMHHELDPALPYTSGNKKWSKLYCGVGGKYGYANGLAPVVAQSEVSTCPTVVNDMGYTPYQLHYQLAVPTVEIVKSEGSLIVSEGENQVELGSGVIVREVAKPVKTSTGYHHINYITNSFVEKGKLNFRTERILAIYKNGIKEDMEEYFGYYRGKWIIEDSVSYGKYRLYINESQFDPTATYTVTYLAEPYQLTTPSPTQSAIYFTNDRTILQETAKNFSNVETNLGGFKIYLDQRIQAVEKVASNKNLLHNWDFRNPINQRGKSSYVLTPSSPMYAIDRWRSYVVSGESTEISLKSNGIKVASIGGSGNGRLAQIIENPEQYAGKTVTFSVKYAEDSAGTCGILIFYNNVVVADTGYGSRKKGEILSLTVTLPEFYNNMFRVQASCGTGSSFVLESAKLELGTTSTLANDPPADYGEQLALCQRYQYRNTSSFSEFLRAGQILTNAIYFDLPIPTSMRVIPTIESYNELKVYQFGSTTEVTGFTFSCNAGNGSVRIVATKTSHGLTDATLNASAVLFNANL